MKLSRLYLKDIRCFKELKIKFDEPGSSILIIGENADGKSTVLRSLAMGLCDQSSASALFRELPGEFVRHGAEETGGIIEVDLVCGHDTFRIQTIITSLDAFERVEQKYWKWSDNGEKKAKKVKIDQDAFPWESIFASGYGAGLRVQGTADFEYFLTVDAVYPLFRYDVPLQNPELIVRRLVAQANQQNENDESHEMRVLNEVTQLLAGILDLESKDQVRLTATGIAIHGRWGASTLSALGDGYRSIVTLILDMVAWWFLKQQQDEEDGPLTDISGIVLIDEIEQHLHPKWQRNIISRLTACFPRVQFIATTHSPLVASGCDQIQVHKIDMSKHEVVSPFGWLAEDVYQAMGLQEGTRARSFRRDVIEAYRALDIKRLKGEATKFDLAKLKQLQEKLDALPEDDPTRLITELDSIRLAIVGSRGKKGGSQ